MKFVSSLNHLLERSTHEEETYHGIRIRLRHRRRLRFPKSRGARSRARPPLRGQCCGDSPSARWGRYPRTCAWHPSHRGTSQPRTRPAPLAVRTARCRSGGPLRLAQARLRSSGREGDQHSPRTTAWLRRQRHARPSRP